MILTIYEMSTKLLGVICTAMLSKVINENIKTEYRARYASILSTEGMCLEPSYVTEREKHYRIKPSAGGWFDLNPKTILNYVAVLITFTVLFMQLNKVL
ncbi:hypothetical protein HDE_06717 [Halotydeus destructor]|nr:hypothetical protein HDE_06717 [Halotydeus destructor]